MDIDENAPGNVSQQGVGGKTDNETAHESPNKGSEVPLPADDGAPVEEEMYGDMIPDDSAKADDPDTDPFLDDDKEGQRSAGVPASDAESGA